MYFSLDDFFRISRLADDPRLRAIVIGDIQEIFPGVLILEQWIDDDNPEK